MGQLNKLTPRRVAHLNEVGRYADGGGLYLQVSKVVERTTKSWVFRYMLAGRARHMGLGSIDDFTLAEARERARQARQQIADGFDPIQSKKTERAARLLEQSKIITFEECAAAYIKAKASEWTNEKHAKQWPATLSAYACPIIGKLPVDTIELPHIEKVLRPVWDRAPEAARRLSAAS